MDVTILQLHKRASYKYKYIQDKFAFNAAEQCFALADGTTQSFNSETWADLITKYFVFNPNFEPAKLIADFKNYVEEYKNTKFEFSTNPAKASLEKAKQRKGGTATFIGLKFLPNNQFEAISCGDTNLFITSDKRIDHFPYSDIDSLDSNKFFINTEHLIQNQIGEEYFHSKLFSYQNNDIILIATDALSRLLLNKPNTISELSSINDFEALQEFCLKSWDKKEMEEDDISAIIIRINGTERINYIIPPEGFSFPEEIEQEFIPTDLSKFNSQNNFTKMDMQEINQQFNGVANDFYQLKKKLKFQEMLLMIAISIGFINLICLFYFREGSANTKVDTQQQKFEIIMDGFKQTIQPLNLKIENLERKINEISASSKTIVSSNGDKEQNINDVDKKDLSKEEIVKRQEELKNAGYNVSIDGKWGKSSEKYWQEHILKVKADKK